MVRLICYNIEYCEGLNGDWLDYLKLWRILFPPKKLDEQIVAALQCLNPDILALVEVDSGSFRSHKDEGQFFGKKLKMQNMVERVKYPTRGFLNVLNLVPILNRQANAILSRYKLNGVKYHMLNEGTKRVVIEASVNCPKKVTLLLAHLALGPKARKKQLEELVNVANNIKGPVILMGDFNTYNGEHEMEHLLMHTRLQDCAPIDHEYTFPSKKPRRRLDYVLTSKDIDVKKYSVLDYSFSDHRPLFVEFDIK